jgi:hypothetical protein
MPQPDSKRFASTTESGDSLGEGASARNCLLVPTINPAAVKTTKVDASSSSSLGAVLNENERVDTLDSQSSGSCQVHLTPFPLIFKCSCFLCLNDVHLTMLRYTDERKHNHLSTELVHMDTRILKMQGAPFSFHAISAGHCCS